MVSARPPPKPKQGRVAYPSAQTYTVGNTETAPASHSPPPSAEAEHEGGSLGPIPSVLSGGSTNAGESTGGVRRKGTLSSRKGSVSGSSGEHDRWDREDRLGEREAGTQGLKSWWKSFRDRAEPGKGKGKEEPTVFGTALGESLKFASIQILTAGPDGGLYVWGCVPVVVAKCGLYLKEHATEVEGTFRVSGSAKRMKELQAMFDSAPKYGKDLTWKDSTYTTHDVATIFRRYLTQMPEPIIPFDNYHDFRACLTTEPFVEEEAIKQYKELIRALPPANQYLLLYVLDLLSVFAKKSDVNLMTAPNLALIFQPGVINHPDHAMRPSEHGLSQRVLEFLIEHQDEFSIGMQLAPVPAGLAVSSSADSPSDAVGASVASPPTPAPPRLVRADSDLMLPSDSDDDAPEGGYYVHEREQFVPRSPVRPLTGTSGVIPSAPPARAARTLPDPDKDIMEPSDSDEDAPPGGYLVKTGDPATGRQTFLSRSKTTAAASPRAERRAGGLSPLPADRSSQGSPHARLTPSPSAPGSAGSGASIARRRTAPTRRTGEGEGGGGRVRKSKGSEAPL